MKDPWFPIATTLIVLLLIWLSILGPMPLGVARWISDWQNLIAAIIAVGAAVLAYRSARHQLAQSELQERNRRGKKRASLRAMLPLALSQIIEYAEDSAFALNRLIHLCEDEAVPRNSGITDLPRPLPHETLKLLAEFIEYSDEIDPSLAENVVAWIQVHDARIRGFIRDNQDPANSAVVTRTNIEGFVIDAASIYAGASALFDYARRRESRPPVTVTWESVRTAFMSLRMWDQDHPRLYQLLEHRERHSAGPFERLKRQ